ncbi:phytase [Luteimonas sp. SJ-92]|uniref:Phytase n=1 Tax=Luteimonas salinisoli TaxID=2752307 RepID=A0A853JDS5_9GAMM|nr:phytase [Luteimonas salinisoli]NZA26882.1 phytase [Luteimonas salinisoli]
MNRINHVAGLALAFGLAGCTQPADAAADAPQSGARAIPTIDEAFVSALTPEDNIDSPAAWRTPDGKVWTIATAKATDRLVVYDGESGATLRTVGASGDAPGEFRRPNGIAVIDDLAFVVERDNHRVQVLQLPSFAAVASFGAGDLVKPYGLWVHRTAEGYALYVTDAYMAGEDADGEDILPPLAALDRRVKRYDVARDGDALNATLAGAFGDTGEEGALRVVESIWGDAANDRLLIAEEDESYANELKVYDLAGNYAGRTLGRGLFAAQAEGIALRTCADGGGWWLTTEQGKGRTVFHLFDRRTLAHAGAVAGVSVANTDGIWLHQDASARFPHGALYAVHDDQGVVAFDWRDIADALSLPACAAAAETL